MAKRLLTSESVTEGHPDKICDQVSDSILDAYLEKDENAHVACETVATTGMLLVMGEIRSDATVDIPAVARRVVKEIGYSAERGGFDADDCAVLTMIDKQSPDIARGVDRALEARESSRESDDGIGAGDQGMMFGFACDETPELMPAPISLAHRLAKRLAALRKSGEIDYLLPDGKTQVTIEYDGYTPKRADTVVVSTQHAEDVSQERIRRDIIEKVVRPTLPENMTDRDTRIFVNPTGRFVVGGPKGDSGLTGRKIIVDTYGGLAGHGGGSFSGKDPTKVDRSASYMARYAAKNLVAAGLARRCEAQIAYAIGVARPVSVSVDTQGTGKFSDEELADAVRKVFDFRPAAIIRELDLRRPIYAKLAAYGQIGREDLGVSWEKTDRVDALRQCFQ